MPEPQVTVIVPVRNGAAYVADAIESALAQTKVRLELVVVDDGSTDETPRILRDCLARHGPRLRVQRQVPRGANAARNAGIALTRAPLLLFLDADDLYPTDYLARFLSVADTAPNAEVFHCGWRGVDFDGRELYAQLTPLPLDEDAFHQLVIHGAPHLGSLMSRRAALDRIGGFDERLPMQQDWDLWLRFAASGAIFRSVPGNVLTVRRRRDSLSARAGARLALVGLHVLERELSRHGRCPLCPAADAAVARWRRVTVRTQARALATRAGLPHTGLGRWLATFVVAIRRPRLARAAAAELAAGLSPSSD